MFYNNQSDTEKTKYKQYLRIAGSLSSLFSDSSVPYLYYRAAENIFCEAFNADNLSRSDVSADAKKELIGIGLKTFLHGNGNTLQKVAEFNAINTTLKNKPEEEIISIVSEARNARIQSTMALYGLDSMLYHCVTRAENINYIFESSMDIVNISSLSVEPIKQNIIKFTDGLHEYSFNISKSTLYKRFSYSTPIDTISIEILKNPYTVLSDCFNSNIITEPVAKTSISFKQSTHNEIIYLPLYAPSSPAMEPALKSGLNQWNAGGRARHPDEVYIPVPSWIHHRFPEFFPKSNDISFDLMLPNGQILSASMCQQGQKGLMSNPNKALGKWLLRDVFKLNEGELLTRARLNILNIDSAVVKKISSYKYKIDFAAIGKYEAFKKKYNI